MIDLLLTNAHLATMAGSSLASEAGLGVIEGGALAIDAGRITWLGKAADVPADLTARQRIDLKGRWITPGLIDCHTHLIYAGSRAAEWEMRLAGASYASISAQGGGIVSTVKATRAASERELVVLASRRLTSWLDEGVTTIEIKSGYGLTVADELKMLRAARQLGRTQNIRVVTSFLGAHTVPTEYAQDADAYLDHVIEIMLPMVIKEGVADALDVFCETIAFSKRQTERLLNAAKAAGLAIKVHADQLSDSGGSHLAGQFHALSADHLEYTTRDGVKAMAQGGVVAVLLPGAFYCLKEKQLPPIASFREMGVPIALATDHNPGSSPCSSILLMLNMGCTLFGLSPTEALLGVTRHAAKALGRSHELGMLAPGMVADLAIWDVEHVRDLCYSFGARPLAASLFTGNWVRSLSDLRAA